MDIVTAKNVDAMIEVWETSDFTQPLPSPFEEGEAWLARYSADPQIYVKAHIGSVVCGPLGPAGEKRFDVIGDVVNELFVMRSGDFVLSPELEQVLETR